MGDIVKVEAELNMIGRTRNVDCPARTAPPPSGPTRYEASPRVERSHRRAPPVAASSPKHDSPRCQTIAADPFGKYGNRVEASGISEKL
eukprot:2445780-Pyramimonas_sp.AAC.1